MLCKRKEEGFKHLGNWHGDLHRLLHFCRDARTKKVEVICVFAEEMLEEQCSQCRAV